jgi:pterin-4a-carbinolamine dehydratase
MNPLSREELSRKKCKVCEVGSVKPMSEKSAEAALSALEGWEIVDGIKIKKEFKFRDFKGSMAFVNYVAAIAEEEGHHPSIFISYNKVRVTLSTFSIGGLTENDFIMAAKIDGIEKN